MPSTILVIGCGPAGMSFCHAMEAKQQAMLDAGEDVSSLPKICVLERAPGPGGVWRATRRDERNDETRTRENSTSMYEGLWTNGAKEAIEYFDFSFDEFIGHALPVYLPRQFVLEYMLARVTRKCPGFFEKYARFNIEVQSVDWNAQTNKFDVVSMNSLLGTITSETYDQCIWAAGENGKPKIPHSMVTMFRDGGFTGRIIHSSDTSNFEDDVKGKRVLLIGGSYSAEDLALTAIKVGADMIYISSRQNDNIVTWTSDWPYDKVIVLAQMQPVQVKNCGKCIQFSKVDEMHGGVFVVSTEDEEIGKFDETQTEICDIHTIIFCTGYDCNNSMLSEELKKPFKIIQSPFSYPLIIPKDWRMDETNLPEHLQGVEPGNCLWVGSHITYPDLYKGTLIDNPNMKYLLGEHYFPLLTIDANAWLLASICTGQYVLPSPIEQCKLNEATALQEMAKFPLIRYKMDSNFYHHYNSTWNNFPEDIQEECWREFEDSIFDYILRNYAQVMQDGNYPLNIGTIDGLNDLGKSLVQMDGLDYEHRLIENTADHVEGKWRTFRDCNNSSEFKSLVTGMQAVPLKMKWMDISDANDINLFMMK